MKTIHEVLKRHPGFPQVAVGDVGAIALGAVFWFAMARLLEPGAYGQVNWLISIAIFASTFCVFGRRKTIVTYYPKEGSDELLGSAAAIVLIASLAVGIAGIVTLGKDFGVIGLATGMLLLQTSLATSLVLFR